MVDREDRHRPYFVVDRRLRIVEWPLTTAAQLRIPASRAVGRACAEVVPAASEVELACSECVGPDGPSSGGDGRPRCTAFVLPGAERALLVWPVTDGQAAGDLVFLGALTEAMRTDDLHENLTRALGLIRRAVNADGARILLADPDGGEPVLTAYHGERDLDGEARGQRQRGKPRVSISNLTVPLVDRGCTLGSLQVSWRRANAPVDRATSLLQKAAAPLSTAIRASLSSLGDALKGVSDPPIRSRAWLERMVHTTVHGTSATLVLPLAPQPLVSSSDRPPCPPDIRDCPCFVTGRSVIIDGRTDRMPPACRNHAPQGRALFCTPVGASSDPRGILVIDYGEELPDPPTRDLVPLRVLARAIADRVPPTRAVAFAPERTTGLAIRCFGSFEVWLDGRRIPADAFARRGAVTLLKILVLAGGKPVSQETIARYLWGDDVDPSVAANRIHGLAHALRAAIEPDNVRRKWRYAQHREDVYFFDVGAATMIDVVRFRQLLDRARRERGVDPAQSLADLEEATNLYRGELFEDEPLAEWCSDVRTRLREQYVEARHALARTRASSGSRSLAIDSLRAALLVDPLREDLHRELIEMLMALNRRHDALEQYRRCVDVLRTELDADPMPETLRLGQLLAKALGASVSPRTH